jgi:hypothetical protein
MSKPAKSSSITYIEKSFTDGEISDYRDQLMAMLKLHHKYSTTATKPVKKTVTTIEDQLRILHSQLEYKSTTAAAATVDEDTMDIDSGGESCQICYELPKTGLVQMRTCGHKLICKDCFNSYIKVRIQDSDVVPWIPCPDASCSIPIHAIDITQFAGLTVVELLSLICRYMKKKLLRDERFVACCNTKDCLGGFIQLGAARSQKLACSNCKTKQVVDKGKREGKEELDPEFKKMIKEGKVKEAPCCKLLTLKEDGLCTIIQCTKCSVVWNWKSLEMGSSIKEMKERARAAGTLWIKSDFEYQLNLEKNNPSEFKALLERNGIKYDPTYKRGT